MKSKWLFALAVVTFGGNASAEGVLGLDNLIGSMKDFAQSGTSFIYIAAILIALYLMISALMMVVKKGRPGAQADESWGAIVGRAAIASCIATLGTKLEAVIAANGSVDPLREALAYAQGSTASSPAMQLIWAAISAWCVFIATIGFLRAFLLWDKAMQGRQDSGDVFWQGLWHLVFSAIVIQIFS